jgi:tRNA threonylcarbamoyladenosine biosynthesis protein TsaB
MLILTLRTDKPEAEIGLYDGETKTAYVTWQADRELAETIHLKIRTILGERGQSFADLNGIVVFKGPGSFTGLRIGISVANALAAGLTIPVVGTGGKTWIKQGVQRLGKGDNEAIVLPEYGAPPNISLPKK